MVRAIQEIELREGVRVKLLFTPSIFGIAKSRDIQIIVEPDGDINTTLTAYKKMIYLAAINAWEAERFDDPSMGDFPYKYIDFEEWSALNAHDFVKMVDVTLECICGKSMKDIEREKRDEEVKKNSRS